MPPTFCVVNCWDGNDVNTEYRIQYKSFSVYFVFFYVYHITLLQVTGINNAWLNAIGDYLKIGKFGVENLYICNRHFTDKRKYFVCFQGELSMILKTHLSRISVKLFGIIITHTHTFYDDHSWNFYLNVFKVFENRNLKLKVWF